MMNLKRLYQNPNETRILKRHIKTQQVMLAGNQLHKHQKRRQAMYPRMVTMLRLKNKKNQKLTVRQQVRR
jgi:hypothetical protein